MSWVILDHRVKLKNAVCLADEQTCIHGQDAQGIPAIAKNYA
ncbi:MAG: hypothetical protein AAFY17_05010 [Cyanobacteria bacterium J06642_11]